MEVTVSSASVPDSDREWLKKTGLASEGISIEGINLQAMGSYYTLKHLLEGGTWKKSKLWDDLWALGIQPAPHMRRISYSVIKEEAKKKQIITTQQLSQRGALNTNGEYWISVKGIVFSIITELEQRSGSALGRDLYSRLSLIPIHSGTDITNYLRLSLTEDNSDALDKLVSRVYSHFYSYLPVVGLLQSPDLC